MTHNQQNPNGAAAPNRKLFNLFYAVGVLVLLLDALASTTSMGPSTQDVGIHFGILVAGLLLDRTWGMSAIPSSRGVFLMVLGLGFLGYLLGETKWGGSRTAEFSFLLLAVWSGSKWNHNRRVDREPIQTSRHGCLSAYLLTWVIVTFLAILSTGLTFSIALPPDLPGWRFSPPPAWANFILIGLYVGVCVGLLNLFWLKDWAFNALCGFYALLALWNLIFGYINNSISMLTIIPTLYAILHVGRKKNAEDENDYRSFDEFTSARFEKALNFLQEEDIPAALKLFEELHLRTPGDPEIQYNLAVCHCALGDETAARRYLRAAIRSKPDYLDDALEDEDLAPLHEDLKSLFKSLESGAMEMLRNDEFKASDEQEGWLCPSCGQSVPAMLEICHSCGAVRDQDAEAEGRT